MIYFHWIYLLVYALLTIPTVVAVLMDNKQPAKTIARIMVLLFMPFLGIVLYVFFGQDIRKQRLISNRSMDQLTKRSMLEFAEQENLHLPADSQPLMRLFANQNWALLSKTIRWRFIPMAMVSCSVCCKPSAGRRSTSI